MLDNDAELIIGPEIDRVIIIVTRGWWYHEDV